MAKTHLIETETLLIEAKTHLIKTKTHLIEIKTHLIEAKTHLIEIKTQLIEAKTHLIEAKTQLIEAKTHLIEAITRLFRHNLRFFIKKNVFVFKVLIKEITYLSILRINCLFIVANLPKVSNLRKVEKQECKKKRPRWSSSGVPLPCISL